MRADPPLPAAGRLAGDWHAMVQPELRLVFSASLLSVRAALGRSLAGLEPLCLSHDDASSVELVLAEVLTNIVKHAYRGDPGGVIDLRIRHGPDGTGEALLCEVRDYGRTFPRSCLPGGQKRDPDAEPILCPEGGYGWFLIRSLANDLSYVRTGGCNCLRFRMMLLRCRDGLPA
ncbi:ATP-binding protein [Profundibacterium mesophilum]|uniref:Anti-sigma regulatory factor n=1 Tax=Profundibacterium mesophilum KAUST100406-0324 TaxID=1037889 RepID=A0A921NRV0_9RHOB|nr:ATP-binding protein [Profundibacterium mesophilum]KAF0676547.1 anti-sigma regulatory factor [Profundibacterium mesophilum KAUST100406-0324]